MIKKLVGKKNSSCWMLGSRKSVSLRVCEGFMRFGIYECMSGILKYIIWIPHLVLQCPSEHVGVSTSKGTLFILWYTGRPCHGQGRPNSFGSCKFRCVSVTWCVCQLVLANSWLSSGAWSVCWHAKHSLTQAAMLLTRSCQKNPLSKMASP